ncbi:MAG: hypothetical protein LBS27_10190 [Bifidobacteriaceae bacterium]|nr:hypothetical protein [Bifidobacteriaceae bacterium]
MTRARAGAYAADRGISLSQALGELVELGLDAVREPPKLVRNPASGALAIAAGRRVTVEEAKRLAEDDD